MPKINVYLPETLASQARAAQLPISEICQRALTNALGAVPTRTPETAPRGQRELVMQSVEERAGDLERAAAALRFALDPDPTVPARIKPIGAAAAAAVIKTAEPAFRQWEIKAQEVAGYAAAVAVLKEVGAPKEVIALLDKRMTEAKADLAAIDLPDRLGDPSSVIDLLADLTERSHPLPAK
jgi:hypothetical protein